jgi:hypothetical protein
VPCLSRQGTGVYTISCEGCAPRPTGILTWDIRAIGEKRKSVCVCVCVCGGGVHVDEV